MPNPTQSSDPAAITALLSFVEHERRGEAARLPKVIRRGVLLRALVPVAIAVLIITGGAVAWSVLPPDAVPDVTTARSSAVEEGEIKRLRDALAKAEEMQRHLRQELDIARKEMRSVRTSTPWYDNAEMLTYRSLWTR